MQFLSQGDYNFPFEWPLYWAKHVYMWSFQSGTPNPDGFIRLPGRVFNFVVFALFGNMAVSYFYVIFSLLVAFAAFYLFSRYFLKVKSLSVTVLGSLFFACNPLFLGNLAKVGLVFAAAMLPLCFVVLQQAFEKQRLRYLVLWIVCLNLSLMHPYTFIVNSAASGIYFCWLAWRNRHFMLSRWSQLLGIGLVAVLLNAYFILPVLSLGSVSKDLISDNVVPTQTDYTSLVNFSNTGDLFTGLALAKNVFLDFDFYNDTYRPLYLLGTFGFYALMIAAYLSTEKYLNARDKRHMAVLLGSFLVLVILATTMVFGVNELIKILITLPAGWAFRSPLKWQLYVPVALFGVLVLLLNNMGDDKRRGYVQLGLVLCFVLMNGFLFYDISKALLTPRTVTHFTALANINLSGRTLLYVNSPSCMKFTQDNPRLVTELNQVFVSQNVQVKRVLIDDLASVNVGSYDYVLSCIDNLQLPLTHQYRFAKTDSFVSGAYQLYTNRAIEPQVYAISGLYSLQNTADVGAAYQFASTGNQPFAFLPEGSAAASAGDLIDVFGALSAGDIHGSTVQASVAVPQNAAYDLSVRPDTSQLYYQQTGPTQFNLAAEPTPGYTSLSSQHAIALPLSSSQPLQITYRNTHFTYQNLIKDSSFETGLWQKHVDDCYNFDNQPEISMALDKSVKTDGAASLRLSAARHIACTEPPAIGVHPGDHYLISFDYQSTGNDNAGLHIAFDDNDGSSITHRLPAATNKWHHYSDEIVIPATAHHAYLSLYAYPGRNEQAAITHYDSVSFMQIPPLQNRLYLTSARQKTPTAPANISYRTINPTKKVVTISHASKPFYLASSDSFDPLWQLAFTGSAATSDWSLAKNQLATTNHVRLNGTMNAWYIDPAQLCGQRQCAHNSDGTYSMHLTMQYVPQHWFYVGALFSCVTWVSTVAYFGFVAIKSRRKTQRYKLWQ